MHAPLCHWFFWALDVFVLPAAPTSALAVAVKVAIDRVAFTPVLLALCIGFMHASAGSTPRSTLAAVRARLPRTLLYSQVIWVPAHILSFRHVPTELRVLYVNAVSVAWNVALAAAAAPPVLPIDARDA